jgi:hypothetical protein
MSKILLESDFLAVNLKSLFNPAADSAEGSSSSTGVVADSEFKNKLLELSIPADVVEKLLTFGDSFKRSCEILGFKIAKESGGNPLLAFVCQEYVQKNLINTNLLNKNTFKALYNAVVKKLVADSEFFGANKYNIIYCQDLYRKSASEIEKYLIAQKGILSPTASSYSVEKLKNRLVFFNVKEAKELDNKKRASEIDKLQKDGKIAAPNALDENTKLNKLELANEIKNRLGLQSSSSDKQTNSQSLKTVSALVNQLNRPEELFALVQYLSTTTDVAEAKEALGHKAFKSLNGEGIAQALIALSSKLSKVNVSEESAKALIAAIIAKLG